MINWYRASPLKIPPPGEFITDLLSFQYDKLVVQCPHLLLWGTQDRTLTYRSTDGLDDFAANLIRMIFDYADHWLFQQIPDQTAAAILAWASQRPI